MLLNPEFKIWMKLTKEEQEEIKACDEVRLMMCNGDILEVTLPSWNVNNVYQADKKEKKWIPWELKDFVGKIIREKQSGVFSPTSINLDNEKISTKYEIFYSPSWWLANGEWYTAEGEIVPCGTKVEV